MPLLSEGGTIQAERLLCACVRGAEGGGGGTRLFVCVHLCALAENQLNTTPTLCNPPQGMAS